MHFTVHISDMNVYKKLATFENILYNNSDSVHYDTLHACYK